MSIAYEPRMPTLGVGFVDDREWMITIGEPEMVDDFGRRLHRLTGGELARHWHLDHALVRSGLVLHNTIPWGNDGGEVWFAEVTSGKRAEGVEHRIDSAPNETEAPPIVVDDLSRRRGRGRPRGSRSHR